MTWVVTLAALIAALAIIGCELHVGDDDYWSASFDGSCGQVHELPDGGYVVARRHSGVGLLRTDSKFGQKWSVVCDPSVYLTAGAVLTAADGGYLVTAEGTNGSGTSLFKVDSSGNMVWRLNVGLAHTTGGFDNATCRTADGGYVVTGGPSTTLVKVSSDGTEEWRTYGDSGYGNWVVQTSGRGYLVACHWPTKLCRFDSAGTVVWSRSLRALMNSISYAYLDPSGECVLASSDAPRIAKVDAAGDVKWQRDFGQIQPKIHSVQPTSDGGFILAGGHGDITLVKTDSLGREEWRREFGADGEDCGTWAEQTADGGYIVAGHTIHYLFENPHSYTIRLKKTDENGD